MFVLLNTLISGTNIFCRITVNGCQGYSVTYLMAINMQKSPNLSAFIGNPQDNTTNMIWRSWNAMNATYKASLPYSLFCVRCLIYQLSKLFNRCSTSRNGIYIYTRHFILLHITSRNVIKNLHTFITYIIRYTFFSKIYSYNKYGLYFKFLVPLTFMGVLYSFKTIGSW